VSPCVPQFQTHLPMQEGSGIVMCPVALAPLPRRGGLWCHHKTCGSRPTSRCGKGSGIAMCHMALDVLWATSKREILNRSTYFAGPTCLRGVPVHSKDA
jgi:hypothetical protein